MTQTLMSIRCHDSIIKAVDSQIPTPYVSRSNFLASAIIEKLGRDGVVIG